MTPTADDKDPDYSIDEAKQNESDDEFLDTPSKADSLKSDKATKIFLEVCKNYINQKTKKFVGTKEIFENVCEELLGHGIKVFVVQCSDRYRNLNRYYGAEKRKANSKWEHFNDLAFLRGDRRSPNKLKSSSPKKIMTSKAKNISYRPQGKTKPKNRNGKSEK